MKIILSILFFMLISNYCATANQYNDNILINAEERYLLYIKDYVKHSPDDRKYCIVEYINNSILLSRCYGYDSSRKEYIIPVNFFNWFFNDLQSLSHNELDSLGGEYNNGNLIYSVTDTGYNFSIIRNYNCKISFDNFNNNLKNMPNDMDVNPYNMLEIFDYYFQNHIEGRILFLKKYRYKLYPEQIVIIINDLNTLLNTNYSYPFKVGGHINKTKFKNNIKTWKAKLIELQK